MPRQIQKPQQRNFKAIIKHISYEEKTKINGAKYVLLAAEIIEGPLNGNTVKAQLTTYAPADIVKHKPERTKSIPMINTEVILHHSVLPHNSGKGFKHIFEVQIFPNTTSDEELTKLLALAK